MELEGIGDVLKRKFPALPEKAKVKIEEGLDQAGIVDACMLKRAKRHHVKKYMTAILLEYVTEEGLFLSEQEAQWMVDAKTLMEDILKQGDFDFQKMQVFESLTWPSLDDIPGRIVTADGRKMWFLGRSGFASLLSKFLESESGYMEYDGIVGGGKTYLQVMLALRCYHEFKGTNKRLVCLFGMPNLASLLFLYLRKALVLAFWDSPEIQRKVLAAEDIDELVAVVCALKSMCKLYFIFDEWNVLDNRFKDSGLQRMWEALTTLENGCRSLHGGSARSEAAVTRGDKISGGVVHHKGQYDRLSAAELAAYLAKENVPEHPLLWRYTGLLPLYVRVFTTCQKAAKDEEELVASFLRTQEVNALHTGFTKMVTGIGTANRIGKLALYSRLLTGAASKDEFCILDDQRWILITQDGHLLLFSEYARAAFMQRLETMLDVKDMDAIIDNVALQVTDECAQAVPNRSLIGWLVERIVVHIAKRWVIGEAGLNDKAVKRVVFFDFMPACSTKHVTACIPLQWDFPYADFVVRYEVEDEEETENGGRKPRLHVNAYEVSLSLASGDRHWGKPTNFLDPIFATRFRAGFEMDEVDWVYTFIGGSAHWVKDGPKVVQGVKYWSQFVTFQELSTSFGASLSYSMVSALQAVDKLVGSP